MPQRDTVGVRRILPNGKAISSLGFGCSSIWSKPQFPQSEAMAILEAAVANGINHFDTAPSYADGEVRLGAFLAAREVGEFVVSTKVGTEFGTHARSFDPARMRTSFEGSLARLGLERIDILYLHGPSEADLTPEVFAFLAELKRAGRISYSGVNSFDPEVLSALIDSPIDVVMLQFSIDDRSSAGVLERLHAAGKVIFAGTVLGQGIFDWKTFLPRDRTGLWYLLRALKKDPLFPIRGRRLARRLQRTGLAPYEAAIRFAVSNPLITSSLFGTSKVGNMVANAIAGQRPLEPSQMAQLR